jgi:F-box-like
MIPRVFSMTRRASTRAIELSPVLQTERTPEPYRGEAGQVNHHVTIETLPDEVLLEIFTQDRRLALRRPSFGPWKWQRLAHVSRRWRFLVFASPCRLELRLYYTYQKPVTQDLSCWPPLPIAIFYPRFPTSGLPDHKDEENVIDALKHHNRVCEINFALTSALLEKSAPLMLESFPTLELLQLRSRDSARRSLILPSAFLGGSAPRLREISLQNIAFPTLPQLLLSTRHLISLHLDEIPRTESFSAEMLVNGLSALTRLQSLKLHFIFSASHPDQSDARQFSGPQHYITLSSLTEFQFQGTSEYLEDLVLRLDTPSLQTLSITFFDQPTFEIPQLSLFIGRTEALCSPCRASIQFSVKDVAITQQFQESPHRPEVRIQLSCRDLGRRVASFAHMCRQLFPFLHSVERLSIKAFLLLPTRRQQDQIDPTQWLDLFRPFQGVKTLEVTDSLALNIASALEHATGRMNQDVFPVLCDLRLNRSRESLSASIEKFTVARLHSGRPISVHYREEGPADHSGEGNQDLWVHE